MLYSTAATTTVAFVATIATSITTMLRLATTAATYCCYYLILQQLLNPRTLWHERSRCHTKPALTMVNDVLDLTAKVL